MNTFDLTGKVVFITGAARGIGRGIADVLAQSGADLALNALTPQYLEPAVAEIAGSSGRRVVPILGDLTDPLCVSDAIGRILAEFGRIDVLVNALGESFGRPLVALPGDDRRAMTEDEIDFVVELNLMGTILCTRAVGPYLIEQGSGKVINISSGSAVRPTDGTIYSVSKAGVEAFTRAQGREWAPHNVQVNAIAPGLFPNPTSHSPETIARLLASLPLRVPAGRFGEIHEVGYLARYLASSESDYMTGQVLRIDGGMTA